jgi:hypothetical protein
MSAQVQQFPPFRDHTVTINGIKVTCPSRSAQDVLQDLHRFHKIYHRIPTSQDFLRHGLFGNSYSGTAMLKHFKKKTWQELLRFAGFQISDDKHWKKNREEMVEGLRALYQELQRPLSQKDIANSFRTDSIPSYKAVFGSLDEAFKAAGVPKTTKRGRKQPSDKRAMLAVIREYSNEFGRAPKSTTFYKANAYHNNHSLSAYIRQFGSWRAAVKLAFQEQ